MIEVATSNFKVFAESVTDANIESDNEYETDTQRVSGVVPGIAVPKMHNKLYKQSTIMAAAIAQVIVQAGLNALDSDYSGLVANLRQTFAGSVNGIKPNAQGDIDISSLLTDLKKLTYPRVGDFIITKNSENPSVKYEGTTWELLEEKTFIMSAGTTAKVGEEGGSNTKTLSVAEMPAHSHTYTMGTAGGHDHTRGTMNITGKLGPDPQHRDDEGPFPGIVSGEGAFSVYSVYGNGSSGDSNYGAYGCDFDASKSWTGSTSYVAAHNHSLTIGQTGSGSAWDSRPKYVAAYIWIRTK